MSATATSAAAPTVASATSATTAPVPVPPTDDSAAPKKKVIKKVKKSTGDAPAPAPAAAPTPEAEAAAEPVDDDHPPLKRIRGKPSKRVEDEPATEPAAAAAEDAAAAAAAAPPAVVATAADVVAVINHSVTQIKDRVASARANKDKETVSILTAVVRELNALRKPVEKLAKTKPVRKTNIDPTRNGFLRPLNLSPEMAEFMGVAPDEQRSRVAVTQRVCAYIRENNLQDPSNRRNILVDETLKKLLDFDPEKEGGPLSYYNIQARVQRHFLKPVAAAQPVAVDA
jgi:chromatin remodeling complex protein RSC6